MAESQTVDPGTIVDGYTIQQWRDIDHRRCEQDFFYWYSRYGYIKDERAGVEFKGLDLWPAYGDWHGHRDYLAALVIGEWVIAGKARQLGISWMARNFETWMLMFKPFVRLAIIAQNDDWAMLHLERVRLIYESQPAHLKRRTPLEPRKHDNQHELALGTAQDFGSIKAYPCKDVRGISAFYICCEELAFWENAAKIMVSVMGAVSDGGQVVINSTGEGDSGHFHDVWIGNNPYVKLFLPWQTHPDRDDVWYARTLSGMPNLSMMQQEYPATPDEMFIASGSKVFERGDILKHFQPPKYTPKVTRPGVEIYVTPQEWEHYAIGIDPADAGGDKYSIDVRHIGTNEQVAHAEGLDWSTSVGTDVAHGLAVMYNMAFVCWERENHGHAVEERMRSVHKYPHCYCHSDGKYGHPTTAITRPFMVDNTADEFREDSEMVIHSESTKTQLLALCYNKQGKPEAPDGKDHWDDGVFSWWESGIAARHGGVKPKVARGEARGPRPKARQVKGNW